MKKALVLGVGGLRGAYDAGVVATLCRELGSNYFDSIYATSVGVCNGSFYVSGQPDTIERSWREFMSGNQLVNYLNPLKGRNILDSEYLIDIMKTKKSFLNLEAIHESQTKIIFTIFNLATSKCEYVSPKSDELLECMRAAIAMPYVHRPVVFNGSTYIDAGLVDPLPVKRAIDDGYDEIIAVYNKSVNFYDTNNLKRKSLSLMSPIIPKKLQKQLSNLRTKAKQLDNYLDTTKGVTVIRPKFAIETTLFNTNKKVINDLFDLGVKDAKEYLKSVI